MTTSEHHPRRGQTSAIADGSEPELIVLRDARRSSPATVIVRLPRVALSRDRASAGVDLRSGASLRTCPGHAYASLTPVSREPLRLIVHSDSGQPFAHLPP